MIDGSAIAAIITDPRLPDNPIVACNDAFIAMVGYEREEILGRNCRFLQGEDRDQECLATIREALAKNAACVVTLRNYRKNKELFLNRLSIRPLVDRDNNVIYYLGVQYDVTNEVKAQEEIEKLHFEIEKRAGA